VIVLMRADMVVYMSMSKDSDSTSRHEKCFEGGRRYVYRERLFVVGEFLVLLALLVFLYIEAIDDFGKYLDSCS
jgi:hypothetical protein